MSKLSVIKTTAVCGLLAAGFLIVATARQAEARPLYAGWWMAKYPDVVKKNDVGKTGGVNKCNVCHIGPKDRTMRNGYAKAIEKALQTQAGKKVKNLHSKDKNVFLDALKSVEDEKSEEAGKTFGELLKADELPVKPK